MSRLRGGCCTTKLRLGTDNARFILLAVFLCCYLVSGAVLFMLLERGLEETSRNRYYENLREFKARNPSINATELDVMLAQHADAFVAGLLNNRRQRWDFAGSFYFVGTVVSTIGFGMTTPRTLPGKIVLIAYGFLGCSGAILFFNLFLERIISFWAFILRYLHQVKMRKKGAAAGASEKTTTYRRDSCLSVEDSLDQWKPSVYKVQFLLFVTSCIIAVVASALYHPMEEWSFFDCVYFCFVTFATIGFGDYVSSQNSSYPEHHWYRLANFLFIVLGCCCIYSFFNVTSLVIRTFLDLVIRKLDIDCSQAWSSACPCCSRHARSVPPLGSTARNRRNAIAADQMHRSGPDEEDEDEDFNYSETKRKSADSTYASDQSPGSDELISMQDFFQTNQVALAMIQKQLWETSQRSRGYHVHEGFQGGVGPLAIVDQKLGQDM